MKRVDAHVHLWDPQRGDYGWLGPQLPELNRLYTGEELGSLLAANGIDAAILVQAAATAAETDYLLALAAEAPWIPGVVGWVELDARGAADALSQRAQQAKLVGIRPMLQDLPEGDWILRPQCSRGLEALEASGLTFDALIRPGHLPVMVELAQCYPGLDIVLDHAAKPAIGGGVDSAWRNAMRELASHANVYCKLSGLMTELREPGAERLIPLYVAELLDAFGSERLIWGSDWPVMTLASSYAEWLALSERCLAGLHQDARERVLGANAVRFYGLDRT